MEKKKGVHHQKKKKIAVTIEHFGWIITASREPVEWN